MKDHINTISTTTEAHFYYEQGYKQGIADGIEECIEIVKSSYRMDAIEKLEQLKEQKNG